MNRQSGFTLIELIIVIVILGILAVTAAPQFINFGGDARASSIQGLQGAVQGASQLEYARTAVRDSSPSYPSGEDIIDAAQLNSTDVGPAPAGSSEWAHHVDGEVAVITLRSLLSDSDIEGGNAATVTTTDCYVSYDASGANEDTPPAITAFTGGC